MSFINKNDLDISVLQKYICAIQIHIIYHLLRTQNLTLNTKTIPLEENVNLITDIIYSVELAIFPYRKRKSPF